jgi:Domain of unknown function (DUF1843)
MAKSKQAHGGAAPYYMPAMREMTERGDVDQMKLALKEAKLLRKKFGNLDAAIEELSARIKQLG